MIIKGATNKQRTRRRTAIALVFLVGALNVSGVAVAFLVLISYTMVVDDICDLGD